MKRTLTVLASTTAAISLVATATLAWFSRDPGSPDPIGIGAAVGRAADRTLFDALSDAIFPGGVRTLDGSENNLAHPEWGAAGTPYVRIADPNYADGIGAMIAGPSPRYISNRVFNDLGQNLFSENRLTQWVWTWGQFLDHTFGLRDGAGETAPVAFDADDPLESFPNELGSIPFTRSAVASGTGIPGSPRQQVNLVSSYVDAWSVYGGSRDRLEWLREGPVDGDLSNNGAHLLTAPGGYLPRADQRGDAGTAPHMELQGGLAGSPGSAAVAGDVRADENMALTAVQTLFVREHNRVVDALPDDLPEELKFQIARRVVGAEMQYITYTQFLPALGVHLDPYGGYDPTANASLSTEFATVAYRAHSMVHGEFEVAGDRADYSPADLQDYRAHGIEVETEDEEIEFEIPLGVAFGNPDLVPGIGLGPILEGLAHEVEYRNDEQIDNQLRSVLFQMPAPGAKDPNACFVGPDSPDCFTAVLDLGALDIERDRDHGIPYYNDLRRAFGLAPLGSFSALTGETTDRFPGELRGGGRAIDDPHSLEFVRLIDGDGNLVTPGTAAATEVPVTGIRRTTLAARLKAIYFDVDTVDAFVGMMAEPHVPGTEFGELQLAMWKQQFEALRDGDRFFYLNDPSLATIRRLFGIDYRHTLAQVISLNSDVSPRDVQANVFVR